MIINSQSLHHHHLPVQGSLRKAIEVIVIKIKEVEKNQAIAR